MPIRLAVDVTPLSRDQRGMGYFASGFLEAWEKEKPKGFELREVTSPSQLASGWTLWSPFNLPSFNFQSTILTIHDLAPFAFPIGEQKLQRRYRRAADSAKHIIVSSNFTRNEVIKRLEVNESKISVAYLGFDPNLEQTDEKIESREKYILAVGTAEPRKNFDGLLKAYAVIKNEIPHRLAIIGEQPPWPSKFGPFIVRKANPLPQLAKELGLESKVIFLGSVQKRSTVLAWYKHASLVAVPSAYEGFGYPVLEAFASNAPLACSNAASLPEVAGDAAVYFAPHDHRSMALAIKEALTNRSKIEEMKRQYQDRLDRFSWKNCVNRYAEIFRSALS